MPQNENAKNLRLTNTKDWRCCGVTGTVHTLPVGINMVQPPWKTGSFLKS